MGESLDEWVEREAIDLQDNVRSVLHNYDCDPDALRYVMIMVREWDQNRKMRTEKETTK